MAGGGTERMAFIDRHRYSSPRPALTFPLPPGVTLHSSICPPVLPTAAWGTEGAGLGGATEEGKRVAALACGGVTGGDCVGRERRQMCSGHGLSESSVAVTGSASEQE